MTDIQETAETQTTRFAQGLMNTYDANEWCGWCRTGDGHDADCIIIEARNYLKAQGL